MGYHYADAPYPLLEADKGDTQMAAAIELLEFVSDAFEGTRNNETWAAFISPSNNEEPRRCCDSLKRLVPVIRKEEEYACRERGEQMSTVRRMFFKGLEAHVNEFELPSG